MEINYWAVLACGVLSMVLGMIWYGPLFGKQWLAVMGVGHMSKEEMDKAHKSMAPLYGLQFALSLFQAYILAHYIAGWTDASGVENALWVWAGFIMPIVAGNAMWGGKSKKLAWTSLFVQGGYNLVLFIIFGLVLGMWK